MLYYTLARKLAYKLHFKVDKRRKNSPSCNSHHVRRDACLIKQRPKRKQFPTLSSKPSPSERTNHTIFTLKVKRRLSKASQDVSMVLIYILKALYPEHCRPFQILFWHFCILQVGFDSRSMSCSLRATIVTIVFLFFGDFSSKLGKLSYVLLPNFERFSEFTQIFREKLKLNQTCSGTQTLPYPTQIFQNIPLRQHNCKRPITLTICLLLPFPLQFLSEFFKRAVIAPSRSKSLIISN